jgi:hypothetical protein
MAPNPLNAFFMTALLTTGSHPKSSSKSPASLEFGSPRGRTGEKASSSAVGTHACSLKQSSESELLEKPDSSFGQGLEHMLSTALELKTFTGVRLAMGCDAQSWGA